MAIRYHYSASTGHEVIVSGGAPLFYPRHMHMRHWTLVLVRRGSMELAEPAGMRRMEAGDFFLVPPRVPHSLRIAGSSELLTLCLDEESMLRHGHELFSGIRHLLFPQECEQIERTMDPLARQACSLAGWQVGGKVRELTQRLVAQPEEALSIAQMARIAGVSPWHFLRRFQSETGMTPHAFLLNCKVRYLRSLLRGKVTAAAAAALAGFADQSHMHKLFKLHHNLTPRQFVLASNRVDGMTA